MECTTLLSVPLLIATSSVCCRPRLLPPTITFHQDAVGHWYTVLCYSLFLLHSSFEADTTSRCRTHIARCNKRRTRTQRHFTSFVAASRRPPHCIAALPSLHTLASFGLHRFVLHLHSLLTLPRRSLPTSNQLVNPLPSSAFNRLPLTTCRYHCMWESYLESRTRASGSNTCSVPSSKCAITFASPLYFSLFAGYRTIAIRAACPFMVLAIHL